MPPVSEAQRRLMWWARNNPKEAAKRGIKASVAREFTDADEGGSLPKRASKSKGRGRYAARTVRKD